MAEDKPAEHLDQTPIRTEIVISHSNLIYWWPVWLAGFVMALITFFDDDRVVIVSHGARVANVNKIDEGGKAHVTMELNDPNASPLLVTASERAKANQNEVPFWMRMSHRPWMGPVFFAIVLLTALITSVTLRGLWSLIVILVIIAAVIIISLIPGLWYEIGTMLGGLHIYVNMAGYLVFGVVMLVAWVLVIFLYDRRRYLLFTPGQMRVHLEIGEGEDTFDTRSMVVKKQQLDFFRHRILGLWFLGLGAGDIEIRTSGARAETIDVPNVWRVDQVLARIQEMQRDIPIVQG